MITFKPRPYQELIISHEIDIIRCNIWAGMGMGKTVGTLSSLEALYCSGEETQPTLVLAPLRVAASTWPDEVAKWDHLRNIEMQPIVGTAKERAAALLNSNASVFTTNYDKLVWLVEQLGGRWPFGTVIADESTRLKSFRLRAGGKRAAALAKVAHKHVHRWVNLTGTPAPNGLIDLWGQAWFVDRGDRLGRTFGAFTSRWFNNIQFPGQQWSKLEPWPHAQEQMQAALADVTISLDAADWFDIDEPIHNVIRVPLPPRARQQYQDMEKEMFLELNGSDIEALNAAAKTVKCLQIASGAIYTDDVGTWAEVHDAKLQALDSILAEAAAEGVSQRPPTRRGPADDPRLERWQNPGSVRTPSQRRPRPEPAGRWQHSGVLLTLVGPGAVPADHRAHRTDAPGASRPQPPGLDTPHHRHRHHRRIGDGTAQFKT